jgi:threonine dehydratase
MLSPTFDDILAARDFVAEHLPPTPLVRVERLSEMLGCDYYTKLENLQPVGAFKVRGGVNLVGTASAQERSSGFVSASTGIKRLRSGLMKPFRGVRVLLLSRI